jgi:2'-5' RNA ligase
MSQRESTVRKSLQQRYDGLWRTGIKAIRAGRTVPDPVLASDQPDRRRGLTLIARPDATVRAHTMVWLNQLRRLEPEQYFYSPAQLHLTILTFFSVTPEPKKFDRKIKSYLAAVHPVLQQAPPLRIQFCGITASPGAVMVQGLFDSEALNDLRDNLRLQLQRHGLGGGMDVRYHLQNAHMTALRFRAPLRDAKKFAAVLAESRQLPFGATEIKTLSLVRNDWYLTRKNLATVRRYPLSGIAG